MHGINYLYNFPQINDGSLLVFVNAYFGKNTFDFIWVELFQ